MKKAQQGKQTKLPMSHEAILKIMMVVTFAVAGIFLVKNLLGKQWQAVVVIGVCLAVFAGLQVVMAKKGVNA